MNAPAIEATQTAILSRLPIFSTDRLTPEVVDFILQMDLAPQDRLRLNYLAEKAREGSLTSVEEMEIEEYRRAGRVVEAFRLKARLAQRRP